MATPDYRSIVWKPILAGAIIATGLSFLFNLFSVAIGLHIVTTTSEGVEQLAFGGLLGTGIGIVASMFASGWLTGYLALSYYREHNEHNLGAIYGFLAWCIALIIAIFLASPMQQYIAGSSIAIKLPDIDTSKLVAGGYVIFCLFFLSALAFTLGGHCAMRCKDENMS